MIWLRGVMLDEGVILGGKMMQLKSWLWSDRWVGIWVDVR